MSLIDSSFEQLAHAAPVNVVEYARRIASGIDDAFGHGYAKRNPAFLAEMVKAASIDFASASLCKTLEWGVRHLADAVREDNANARASAFAAGENHRADKKNA